MSFTTVLKNPEKEENQRHQIGAFSVLFQFKVRKFPLMTMYPDESWTYCSDKFQSFEITFKLSEVASNVKLVLISQILAVNSNFETYCD